MCVNYSPLLGRACVGMTLLRSRTPLLWTAGFVVCGLLAVTAGVVLAVETGRLLLAVFPGAPALRDGAADGRSGSLGTLSVCVAG